MTSLVKLGVTVLGLDPDTVTEQAVIDSVRRLQEDAAPKTYNGWTNYETWCVNLWIDNEQGSQRAGLTMAEDAWDEAEAEKSFTRLERAQIDLARMLKDEYAEAMPAVPGVWADLLGAAFSEVNWMEIAGRMLDEVDKAEEPEEAEAE